jgi:hypothetical protein
MIPIKNQNLISLSQTVVELINGKSQCRRAHHFEIAVPAMSAEFAG